MGWDEVFEKVQKDVDSVFISCNQPAERRYLRDLIKKEFPDISGPRIDSALNYCCSATRKPRLKSEFLRCLRKQLGV